MFSKNLQFRNVISAALIAAFWLTPVWVSAQDLVPVSSITGSSSVFVFRNQTRAVRRVASVRPARTKEQRLETVRKVKKQYETIAKVTPRRIKGKVVDPYNLPKNIKTLPAAAGSRLFAGVGEYFIEKGEYEKSLQFFSDAVALDDKNLSAKTGYSEALAVKGNDLLLKDQADAAKVEFLNALKYDPKNAAAYFGLGEVYAALDQTAEAIANYERSLENDKDLTEIYVPLGILYYQSGEIAKADQLLTKALAFSNGSSETQFFLGLVRAAQNRNDEALAAFQKAKALDSTSAESFYYSGEILSRLKRPSQAIPDYKEAVALKPNYFDAWLGLGEAFYEVKNYAEAITAFQTASRIKNDNWQAYSGWGDALLRTGKFSDAAVKFNLAATFLSRTTDFDKNAVADLYTKVGYAYGQQCEQDTINFKACKWPAAIKALEKAVELSGDPLAYTNLGWAYFNASRIDKYDKRLADQQAKLALAKTVLQKVVSSNSVITDSALQNLGAVLIDLGDFKGAIDVLKKIVNTHPEWTFSGYALGSAYAMVNDNDNAAKAFRAALDKDPKYVAALKSLGFIEIRRKNGKEVRKIIEDLRKLSMVDALVLERDMKAARL